jgi:hypothetical protein
MNHKAENLARAEAAAAKFAPEAPADNAALDSQTEMVEGKVTEIAKTSAGENATGQKSQQSTNKEEKKYVDPLKSDRAKLRDHLIKTAPPEKLMKKELKKVLLKKKVKLEGAIKKHRRKKNYHLLSKAIAQLRQVVFELKSLASMSFEAVRDTWLKVVHKFA